MIKSRLYSTLSFVIGWPLSLLALFYVSKLVLDKNGSFGSMSINPALVLYGFVCFLFYYILRTAVWKKLLAFSGHNVSFKETAYLWSSSEIKRYLPGNIWALLGRATSFSDKKIPTKTIVLALLFEGELVILAGLLISLFALRHLFNSFLPYVPFKEILILLIQITIFSGCFIYSINVSLRTQLPRKIESITRWLLPPYSLLQNLRLLFLMTLSLFFFSLGSYFSIIAFTYIPFEELLTVVGIMSLSLLIGYLSIITPMGLGVREAAASVALSKLIPLQIVGVTVLFARVLLIVTDITYFALSSFLFHVKNKYIAALEHALSQQKQEVILFLFLTFFITYFTHITFLRYENFYTGRFDLGNMDQTVWNTLYGRIFQTSSDTAGVIPRLSAHADFMLILLVPFYAVWPDARMLLLLQTVIVGFGVFFVYLISVHYTRSRNISLAFGISYLFNPFVHHTILYDFHAVTLATTLLLGAYYFFLKKKYWHFAVFAILAAITKEQVWLIIALFGLVDLMRNLKAKNTRKLISLALFIIPLCIFVYIVWAVIPGLRGSHHFAISYYSDFGTSPTEIVKNIIFSPVTTAEIFLREDRMAYVSRLFSPVGFLALLSPVTLVFALPDLLINILSSNEQLRHVYYQYSASLTPFIFISAIAGLKKVLTSLKSIPSYAPITYLLFWTFLSAYQFGPLPGARFPNLAMIIAPQKNKEFINKHLATIPSTSSVSATNNLGSHLSQRQELYSLPFAVEKADYVAILLDRGTGKETFEQQKEVASVLKKDKRYRLIAEKDAFFLFKKSPL